MKFAPVLWELRHIGAGTPWKYSVRGGKCAIDAKARPVMNNCITRCLATLTLAHTDILVDINDDVLLSYLIFTDCTPMK